MTARGQVVSKGGVCINCYIPRGLGITCLQPRCHMVMACYITICIVAKQMMSIHLIWLLALTEWLHDNGRISECYIGEYCT